MRSAFYMSKRFLCLASIVILWGPAFAQSTSFTYQGKLTNGGRAGGTPSGNVVNATTQYNLDGNRVLSAPGTNNLFA